MGAFFDNTKELIRMFDDADKRFFYGYRTWTLKEIMELAFADALEYSALLYLFLGNLQRAFAVDVIKNLIGIRDPEETMKGILDRTNPDTLVDELFKKLPLSVELAYNIESFHNSTEYSITSTVRYLIMACLMAAFLEDDEVDADTIFLLIAAYNECLNSHLKDLGIEESSEIHIRIPDFSTIDLKDGIRYLTYRTLVGRDYHYKRITERLDDSIRSGELGLAAYRSRSKKHIIFRETEEVRDKIELSNLITQNNFAKEIIKKEDDVAQKVQTYMMAIISIINNTADDWERARISVLQGMNYLPKELEQISISDIKCCIAKVDNSREEYRDQKFAKEWNEARFTMLSFIKKMEAEEKKRQMLATRQMQVTQEIFSLPGGHNEVIKGLFVSDIPFKSEIYDYLYPYDCMVEENISLLYANGYYSYLANNMNLPWMNVVLDNR